MQGIFGQEPEGLAEVSVSGGADSMYAQWLERYGKEWEQFSGQVKRRVLDICRARKVAPAVNLLGNIRQSPSAPALKAMSLAGGAKDVPGVLRAGGAVQIWGRSCAWPADDGGLSLFAHRKHSWGVWCCGRLQQLADATAIEVILRRSDVRCRVGLQGCRQSRVCLLNMEKATD